MILCVYIHYIVLPCVVYMCMYDQGGSVATSQSAETGSSTAMMDVDSMTSQVRTHSICYTPTITLLLYVGCSYGVRT